MKKSWSQWFEIPVRDMERAKRFYETVFDVAIEVHDLGPLRMGIFPHGDVGCALCAGDHYRPSADGVVVYLDAGPDLSVALSRIEAAGGKILQPKKQISPQYGFMALFLDCEGNRLALHSMI
jgi:hypothetical protein